MLRFTKPVAVCSAILATACITVVQSGSVEVVPVGRIEPRQVVSPMKAFLVDGSTVLYSGGVVITGDSILGPGTRHLLGLTDAFPVMRIGLDSIAGIEAFQGRTNTGGTIAASLGLTALAGVGTVALAVAIFGSCPTFYTSEEHGSLLQAEAFSYSIAPLLEARDLDAMHVAPDADGVVRLELRNEALETHYINHLELLAVDHAVDARVIPDHLGLPVGVRAGVAPTSAVDRQGRDVRASMELADDASFASSTQRIRSATGSDPDDYVDLTFSHPGGDEAVVQLLLRNSLLNTVLFYDMMLGSAGAGAVDWVGQDMNRIDTVLELGSWFQGLMGLKVEVHDGEAWVPAGRLTDTGPIAWEEVGVPIPLPGAGDVRVRLRFLTDAWRIDRVALAESAGILHSERVPIARIEQDGVPVDFGVLEQLARPDDEYLATHPASSALLEFDPPPKRADVGRSFLLSTQGYYTEWIRPDWIRAADQPTAFRPDAGTVEELMARWLDRKDSFEAEFYNSKVPVR